MNFTIYRDNKELDKNRKFRQASVKLQGCRKKRTGRRNTKNRSKG